MKGENNIAKKYQHDVSKAKNGVAKASRNRKEQRKRKAKISIGGMWKNDNNENRKKKVSAIMASSEINVIWHSESQAKNVSIVKKKISKAAWRSGVMALIVAAYENNQQRQRQYRNISKISGETTGENNMAAIINEKSGRNRHHHQATNQA